MHAFQICKGLGSDARFPAVGFMPRQWTVAEIVALGNDYARLLSFLASFGILEVPECCQCGGLLAVARRRGKARLRCRVKSCQRWVNVRHGTVLEGFHMELGSWLLVVYLWAVQTSFSAAVTLSGLSKPSVAKIFLLLRLCAKRCCDGYGQLLGGRGCVVEVDETECGRKRKGLHGHPTSVKMDVWGAVDRCKKLVIFKEFKKWHATEDRRRAGPASAAEVLPFVSKYVACGSTVFSDGLKAYRCNLEDMGYVHDSVKHADGQFSKVRPRRMTRLVTSMGKVHTNTIDGYWGSFKNAMRGMKSLRREHQPLFLAEFMWRHNASVLCPTRSIFEQMLTLLADYRDDHALAQALSSLCVDD